MFSGFEIQVEVIQWSLGNMVVNKITTNDVRSTNDSAANDAKQMTLFPLYPNSFFNLILISYKFLYF